VANVVVSALATWNGKALKKAKQDVNVFDKQLKSLARTLGFTFSATAIVAFSKKAVKAFAEDEASAKSLQIQLENTGNAFRVTEVEAYIKSLEKTYAILTDLRGPFQTLLNVTGSVDLAQRSLEAALDISAGTGQSLTTVVAAISAGVRGQTKGIKSLNSGIDENILATGDMNKIMEELEKRFAGQATARLGTYAGKMDALKKSAGEATKIIGEGLIDALDILSEDETVTDLSEAMENFAENTAAATKAIAKLAKGFSDFANDPAFKPAILALGLLSARRGNFTGFKAAIAYVGVSGAIELATKDFERGSSQFGGTRQLSKDLMITKLLNKARKEEFDVITKKNAIENKNVEELKKKFDLERIGLTAALNQATDDETRIRLKAQLAILDNNEALAKKLLAELEAIDALKRLADAANQFKALGLTLQESMALAAMSARYQAQADAIAGRNGAGSAAPQMSNDPYDILVRQLAPELNTSYGLSAQEAISLATSSARYQAQADAITLRIDASGDKMSQAIAESIQQATRNGFSTSAAGQLP
jgi:hypothetical protein